MAAIGCTTVEGEGAVAGEAERPESSAKRCTSLPPRSRQAARDAQRPARCAFEQAGGLDMGDLAPERGGGSAGSDRRSMAMS
jgi:hypothetical protein